MKKLSLYLLLVCFAVFATQTSSAQKKKEKDEKQEVHVKVKVIENGNEKVLDTVFYEFKGHNQIIEMMELKGMSDSLMKKHHVWVSDGEDEQHGKHKRILKTIVFSSDSAGTEKEIKMMRNFNFSNEQGNVFIHGGDSCIKKNIRIEMIEGGKHKIHRMESHGEKGERVIIINDSDDVEITEEDGYKIIKIKTSDKDKVWVEKDTDVEVTVEVEVDDNGSKKVKKIKKKKSKE